MKDRFKFRIFNIKTKEYVEENEMLEVYLACGVFELSITGCKTFQEKYIMEQSTGLKDNNGKIIFEGDIVLYTNPMTGEQYKQEVYFDTELCEFGFKNSHELLHNQFSDEFEVVGNIHKDKELNGGKQ